MKTNSRPNTNVVRKHATNIACLLIPVLIYTVPGVLCFLLITNCADYLQKVSMAISPLVYSFGFACIAGIISMPFQSGVIPGRFPRLTGNLIYSKRKIYGTCWTTVFYCKPVYFLILNTPIIKKITFRLFGYHSDLSFTVYPDCWVRDLCLLELGKNVYLSNRATIGTNICHIDNTISVDKITIGENSIIGHLAMIAHGVKIGSDSEIGVGCGIGIKATIGSHVNVGPMCMINHYAQIGNHVIIGTKSYIGACAKIADNIKIPPGAIIPDKAIIKSPSDIYKYLSSAYLFRQEEKDLHISVNGKANHHAIC